MKTCITLIFVFVGLTQAVAQQKEFSWLVGQWKLQRGGGAVFEDLSTAEDQKTLIGISYHVSGADTVVNERIKIVWQEESFYYVPDIAGDQA